jgi:hypothetical protein
MSLRLVDANRVISPCQHNFGSLIFSVQGPLGHR